MPFLCGPKNSRYAYTGTLCPHLDLALRSNAHTLAEAIFDYEQHFDVRVTPMLESFDGNSENFGKYFKFTDLINNNWQPVDIHVIRDNGQIFPKQDLSFSLHEDDVLEFVELFG